MRAADPTIPIVDASRLRCGRGDRRAKVMRILIIFLHCRSSQMSTASSRPVCSWCRSLLTKAYSPASEPGASADQHPVCAHAARQQGGRSTVFEVSREPCRR